jgi:hypothetical protein
MHRAGGEEESEDERERHGVKRARAILAARVRLECVRVQERLEYERAREGVEAHASSSRSHGHAQA